MCRKTWGSAHLDIRDARKRDIARDKEAEHGALYGPVSNLHGHLPLISLHPFLFPLLLFISIAPSFTLSSALWQLPKTSQDTATSPTSCGETRGSGYGTLSENYNLRFINIINSVTLIAHRGINTIEHINKSAIWIEDDESKVEARRVVLALLTTTEMYSFFKCGLSKLLVVYKATN